MEEDLCNDGWEEFMGVYCSDKTDSACDIMFDLFMTLEVMFEDEGGSGSGSESNSEHALAQ